jgi:hypothetical protein
MSLINDALRRASQSERNQPQRGSNLVAMKPVPVEKISVVSLVLAVACVVALALAGYFFWQLWNARHQPVRTVVAVRITAPVSAQAVAQPVTAVKAAPTVPTAPANPAPAPVIASAAPVAAQPAASPAVAPSTAAPTAQAAPPTAPAPTAEKDLPVIWPVQLKLSAVFYSKTHPRALINGNVYEIGDQIQGVVVKSIEKDAATVEWTGHSKTLILGD